MADERGYGSLQTGDNGSSSVMGRANPQPEPDEHTKLLPDDVHTGYEVQRAIEGHANFHRLGWKRLTVVSIVEAIALGALSLPQAFAVLGMIPGIVITIGMGIVAIYTSYIIGAVKIKFPSVAHYGDIGQLLMGDFGYWLFSAIFVFQLTLSVGSHCLTGMIAFANITESSMCALVFGGVSAVILLLLAIPPTFADVAILGYIDFVSIILAIGVTMVGTGIQQAQMPGGLAASDWSYWPAESVTFPKAAVAISNIVFAYAFAGALPSFMNEMHTPKDYVKSITALGVIEISIYVLTGSIIYAFVGQDVQSPALLSAGPVVSKIAFGIALPVIFISGSINTTVVARFIHSRIYRDSVVQYVNTVKGWVTWLALVIAITAIAWVIAESIPFFSELMAISAALLVSGMSFYFPPVMWLLLLKDGDLQDRKNVWHAVCNLGCFFIGVTVLVCGVYASIVELSGPITTPPATNATESFPSLVQLPSASDANSLPPDESVYFNLRPSPPRLPAWLETFVDPPTEFVDQRPVTSQETAFTPFTGMLQNASSIQWDTDLDAQVPNWLAGDDFDLNALNSSVLASAINDIPLLVCNDDDISLLSPHGQSINFDEYHEEYHIRRHWFSFIPAGDTGHVTPDLMPVHTEVDDQYREGLSRCLQQRVLSEPLPSTEFLVSLCHVPNYRTGS
ncbi:hypothetical protein N7476_010317 [Penicillium atrosanguineum]|uniref:Amino acid transporter transmembrane domain-containing protein n=1 Tax=Penicillium atrosanguineum TaxID=1132637 RepID=A0A9W9PR91_9EURO|nr:hypothetical protein N7476_010317 [Penicillium atrosanguineum]